jgi:hypothetical protein
MDSTVLGLCSDNLVTPLVPTSIQLCRFSSTATPYSVYSGPTAFTATSVITLPGPAMITGYATVASGAVCRIGGNELSVGAGPFNLFVSGSTAILYVSGTVSGSYSILT